MVFMAYSGVFCSRSMTNETLVITGLSSKTVIREHPKSSPNLNQRLVKDLSGIWKKKPPKIFEQETWSGWRVFVPFRLPQWVKCCVWLLQRQNWLQKTLSLLCDRPIILKLLGFPDALKSSTAVLLINNVWLGY